MKPAPFHLHLPSTLDEALAVLAGSSNARAIAGGQSLMPILNLRLAVVDDLVDLNGIAQLSGIAQEGDYIVIGAMTRQREIEQSPLVARTLPLLSEAVGYIGHNQTRSRGTVGGSLCNLDPSAEIPTVAMAMDSEVTIARQGSQRTVPMCDFALGLMSTCLDADELLTSVRLKPWLAHSGHGFVEYGRRHGDYAIVSAAALIELAPDGRVLRCSFTLGGVAHVPCRVPAAEQMLQGQRPEPEAIKKACAQASEIPALTDPAYPEWYRQRLAARLLERAVHLALERATAVLTKTAP